MSKSIKDILKSDLQARINGSLWFETDGGRFFGPGPVELLERIAQTGSLARAAKEMKMSYKKAWELINHLNAQASAPVVILQSGGEKGGGSSVTPEGMELIKYHRQMRKRFTAFLERETELLNR